MRCKQCENPRLKGLHTCKKRKKKSASLIKRLREPIDPYSDFGLREKVEAIGEALALLMKDREGGETVREAEAYNRGMSAGYSAARSRLGDGDMGG